MNHAIAVDHDLAEGDATWTAGILARFEIESLGENQRAIPLGLAAVFHFPAAGAVSEQQHPGAGTATPDGVGLDADMSFVGRAVVPGGED